jgi:hypothetical protein
MNQTPDPKRELQDSLDKLRDQILADLPAPDQQAYLAELRRRIEGSTEPSISPPTTRLKPVYLLAAAVLLGIVTALLQPWDSPEPAPTSAPPVALLKDLDLIRSLSQLEPAALASLTAIDLGAATLVFEKEQDVPFDLLLAAVEEEE